MHLPTFILSFFLLQVSKALSKPGPAPRQLFRLGKSELNQLAARQPQDTGNAAPVVSGPSSFTTTTTPVATTSPTTTTSTNPTTIPDPPTSSTTTGPISTTTPTGPRNHNIAVGQNGTQFTPSTLRNIVPGSTLTFYFYPTNYSIIQSSFNAPCQPLGDHPIYSDFQPASSSTSISRSKFTINITNSETIWIYAVDGTSLSSSSSPSSGTAHTPSACNRGMALVINPLPKESAAGQTLSTYKKNAAALAANADAAQKAEQARCPESIWGGEVRGVSEKEFQRWMGKHPAGGNGGGNGSGSAAAGGAVEENSDDVERYVNGGVGRRESRWMALGLGMGLAALGLFLV